MKPTNKLYLDWSRYLNLIDQLYNKVDWKKENFKKLIGIHRGGSIPTAILSHKTGIPSIILNRGGMIYETEKFCVIDDIADTGSTLSKIDYLSQGVNFKNNPLCFANKNFKIATLHYRKQSKVVPDYFVEMVDRWVVYPYEND
jgi:hypoxanthine phosphoribosyltransferase